MSDPTAEFAKALAKVDQWRARIDRWADAMIQHTRAVPHGGGPDFVCPVPALDDIDALDAGDRYDALAITLMAYANVRGPRTSTVEGEST